MIFDVKQQNSGKWYDLVHAEAENERSIKSCYRSIGLN
uniref:Uncharacterized protein n=1 Tax=Setaria italica TaxID=4555 RepID=K3XTL9_SETIT